ncbi:TonB-dependent receptor [Sphingomonas donggukensis]|uniref:TonB-dependent receptor n=1 Tax=Sphingomonas donggukensis TaxID=2949093 RepID=A0ABY4TZE4_9SPHN|nr:TonB-dependent receptor [Sphingomonas donggukensis]URW76932.1 TonB-dependent receptor [Sphingomonas donggukensis]
MKPYIRRRLLASTLLISAAALSTPAYAQVAEATETAPDAQQAPEAQVGEDIVITGSRIARPDLEVASPVNVIGSEEIALRQPNTAEDLLRELPSVRPNLGPAVNNGSDGSAAVDLRGIGANRTLVILDGRRIVPFGLDGVVDLNVIPTGLVERVDVVTGGASSVYGADAVAGVVNFITKRNFSGIQASGNYRVSELGDAVQYRGDLLVGANLDDGRGNVVLGLGYANRKAVLATSRKIAEIPIGSGTGTFLGSTGSVPAIFQSSLATTTNPNGLPTTGLGAVIDPATGSFRAATQADTFNTNLGTYFLTPLEQYNVYASGRYEVADNIEVYATGMFTRNKAELALASSGTFGNAYDLPLNNPYLPTTARNQLCAANGISVADCNAAAAVNTGTARTVRVIPSRRFAEYGPRGNPIESTMFQVQAGIRGDIVEGLKFDVSAQYGETNQNQARINWGSSSKVQQALLAYRNAAGQLVCSNTANGCVPLNVFGANGSITPDQIAFIDLDAQIRRLVSQKVITGSINGDLFNLTSPFANSPIAFSIGAEYRKLTASATPDAPSQIQGEVLGTGARTPPDFGTYDVREAFGEIIIPLIEDNFLYRASIEAGVRYSDYSTTGGSTTWKAGGTIEPIQGFKFRGMYQKAVRSPNIQELFQSPVQGLSNLLVDPCAGAAPTASRTLCEGTGAPAGTYGGISQPSSNQINVTTSGNPNLDVERATTYTLGAVIAPRFIPRFSLTVDYFNIKIRDLISAPSQNDILNGCYSTTLNPSQTLNGFCSLIRRNPLTGSLNGAGETPGVILGSSNLGRLQTAGIDVGFNYAIPLGNSELRLGFNGTWLDYYRIQATPLSIFRECKSYYSTSCTNARPEYKWNARASYDFGVPDVSLLWNHISKVRLEDIRPASLGLNDPGPGNTATAYNGILPQFRQVKSYDYFDLNVRFDVSDEFEFGLLVENLFDKKPPLLGNGVAGTAFNNGNTMPTIYDVIGRAYTISGKLKF